MEFMRQRHMLQCNIKGRAKAASGLPAVAAAALICSVAASRSEAASCREAANGLIALLDAGKDDTALYRDTYAVVVNTCGAVATAPHPAAPPDRARCHDLAATMVDLIEDDTIDSAQFAQVRERFDDTCAPR